MKKILLSLLLILSYSVTTMAQEENTAASSKNEVDPSKPTNLYTQINALGEVSMHKNYKIYGTRFNVQYTFNPDNLLLFELPFMYHDQTQNFGLSDVRFRYFSVVKRNLSNHIIALAPFADVTMPTGSTEKGLGSGRWSIGIGSVIGIVINKNISLFPGLSYVHVTKSKDNLPFDASANGFNTQVNMSIKFNKRTFMFINPIYTRLYSQGFVSDILTGEFNLNYIAKPNKLKLNIGWFPNFTDKINTVKFGATFYI